MLPTNNSSVAMTTTALSGSAVKDSYLDQNALNSVKTMGRHKDPQALKEIAKKFEAMFVQQMLKSMRDANEVFDKDDMFSSDEVKFHQEMLDQQLVLNLTSGQGMGLAKVMYQQLLKSAGNINLAQNPNPAQTESTPAIKASTSVPVEAKDALKLLEKTNMTVKPLSQNVSGNDAPALISRKGIKHSVAETPDDFIAAVKPYAEKAAAELRISPDILMAQAALETGWGKHVLHDAQGNNSFNMFNIKATGAWQGKKIGVKSLEFNQGVTQQEHSEFRHYDNYRQSFSDYVSLIKNNPRYESVLNSTGNSEKYADALQASGYATDPHYAAKLKRLLASDVIRSAVDITAVPSSSPSQS